MTFKTTGLATALSLALASSASAAMSGDAMMHGSMKDPHAMSMMMMHQCKAAISATGHGQAIEKHRFDYGAGYAMAQAQKLWRKAVIAADGPAYANLADAHDVKYSQNRGAGQIYVTLTARPCR